MTFDGIMSVYRDAFAFAHSGGQDEESCHAFGFHVSERWKDSTLDEYLAVANFAHEWRRYVSGRVSV
jgi:antirestriction protein